jgi:hypothetical protein
MEGVKTWLISQDADFSDTGIQNLFPRYKCLSSGDDCVEKFLKDVCIFLYIINIFVNACFVNSSEQVTF